LSFSFTENSLSHVSRVIPQSHRWPFPETAKSVHQKLLLIALRLSGGALCFSDATVLFHANHVPRIRQSVIDGRLWKRFEQSTLFNSLGIL
jgi:hypothetical protein